jgi:phosphate/sulfate permease
MSIEWCGWGMVGRPRDGQSISRTGKDNEMVPLYALFIAMLNGLKRMLAKRAVRLERKFARAALAAQQAVKTVQTKPGNGSTADPLMAAKRQYELGKLAEDRDQLESKYVRWQSAADRLERFVTRLQNWKGRGVPYAFGVIDTALVLGLLYSVGIIQGFDPTLVQKYVAAVNW